MLSAAAPRGADDPPAAASLIRVPPLTTAMQPMQPMPPMQQPPPATQPPQAAHASQTDGASDPAPALRRPVSERPDDFPPDQLRDLHARLAAGDADALAQVHARYARYLAAAAAQITADREAAAEVVQDVLVHLWEHPLRFDPDRGGLRAYLVVMARRRAVDWVRRESARRPSETVARELAATPDGPAADTVVLTEVTAAIVRRGVADLPSLLREAVELAFFDGYTYREVATRLTIPEGTAKSRIRAALQKLAVRLEREGVHV